MVNEWDLTETNLYRASRKDYEVGVLPIGAIEPHNRHLPYGQDWRHTTYVARESCKLAWEKTQSVLCLPTIPYGVDCNLMEFPLAIHVSQATLDRMVREIVVSLHAHGIRKIVLVNGHGGNDFVPLVRQTQCDLDVYLFLCNWWTVGLDKYGEIFENPDDHAGEMETSLALELYPNLVEPGVAGDGRPRPYRFDALKKGWLTTSRNFGRLNDHCAVGDPSKASPEKGRQYLDLVCKRIGVFLAELAEAPIDEYFPHVPG